MKLRPTLSTDDFCDVLRCRHWNTFGHVLAFSLGWQFQVFEGAPEATSLARVVDRRGPVEVLLHGPHGRGRVVHHGGPDRGESFIAWAIDFVAGLDCRVVQLLFRQMFLVHLVRIR